METRANYVAVGVFTILAIVATFALVYWTAGYSSRDSLVPLDVRIEGSVSGLGPGSVVQFNGITVGRVEDLSLDTSDPRYVVVHTKIDPNTPVRSDTKASVGLRGLSGGAFIALEGGTAESAAILVQAADAPEGFTPRIVGDPSAISDLIVRVNAIANQVENTMSVLNEFVLTNQASLTSTFASVDTFAKSLAANSDGVSDFMASAGEAAKALEGLSGKIDATVTQVERIVGAVDPEDVSRTLNGAAQFSERLGQQGEALDTIMASAITASQQLGTLTAGLNDTVTSVNGVLDAVDPARIRSTVEGIDRAAGRVSDVLAAVDGNSVAATVDNVTAITAGVRAVVEDVDRNAINGLLTDLRTTSQRLAALTAGIEPAQVSSLVGNIDAAAEQARSVLAGIDSSKITSTLNDVSAAASSARGLVETVDRDLVQQLVADVSNASRNVASLLSAIDAERVNLAVDSVTKTAEGAQQIVADVRGVTQQLSNRGDDVGKVVDDAVELSARLNETSKKIDGVIEQVNTLLGSDATSGIVNDVQQTLAEFRNTAKVLAAEVSSISGNVDGLARRGLGDTQTLIRDARQSIGRIDRVIRKIEDNPSSLISGSGGSRIRETDGGRPRR